MWIWDGRTKARGGEVVVLGGLWSLVDLFCALVRRYIGTKVLRSGVVKSN